jgi:hypothetical protein
MSTALPPAFERVIVIMFENMYRSYVMQNRYMRHLAEQGQDLRNYFGVMHPSQTNYIASIAGELCNVTYDDRPPAPLQQNTVVDLFEAAATPCSWKAYMDSYQPLLNPWSANFQPQDQFPYLIKHNPFSSFQNITGNSARWAKISNEIQFFEDVANGTLPQYAWFTPNMWNDGHYIIGTQQDPPERAPFLVDQLACWLEYFFGVLKFPGPASLLPKGTLVVVTFDESDYEADWDKGKKYTYDGPNQVYTVLLGDMIRPGHEDEGYNHYSLIKTIEQNFGLGTLEKNDEHSNCFEFLWGRRFVWGGAQQTPLLASHCMASAECAGKLWLAYATANGELALSAYDGSQWSAQQIIAPGPVQQVALCALDDTLYLAWQSKGELNLWAGVAVAQGWDWRAQMAPINGVGHIALCAFYGSRMMLAWQDSTHQLQSLSFQEGAWAAGVVPVGHQSDGHLCLGSIGPSLYLIHKAAGCDEMRVISYNAAAFNVVTCAASEYSGPYNDTTQNQWSPSAFPVAHFSHMAAPVTPGEQEPATRAYVGRGPLAIATLNGVMHLVHRALHSDVLETETFSIAGVMTAKLPVSYRAKLQTSTSDGYGTLAEAGWSHQHPLGIHAKGSFALATFGERLVLLVESAGKVVLLDGQYTG